MKYSHLCPIVALTFALCLTLPIRAFAEPAKVPLGRAEKPLPPAASINDLLPLKVGGFERFAVDGDIKTDDEAYGTYKKGTVEVLLTVGRPTTISDAKEGVKTAQEVLHKTIGGRPKSERFNIDAKLIGIVLSFSFMLGGNCIHGFSLLYSFLSLCSVVIDCAR